MNILKLDLRITSVSYREKEQQALLHSSWTLSNIPVVLQAKALAPKSASEMRMAAAVAEATTVRQSIKFSRKKPLRMLH